MTNTTETELTKSIADPNSNMRHIGPATKRINWLVKNLPDPQDQREYARDRCVVAYSEAIGKIIHESNISRVVLAAKLGKSPSNLSRLLNGGHNMTLKTLADVLWACDYEVVDPVKGFGPLGVIEISTADASAWVSADRWTTIFPTQAVA